MKNRPEENGSSDGNGNRGDVVRIEKAFVTSESQMDASEENVTIGISRRRHLSPESILPSLS